MAIYLPNKKRISCFGYLDGRFFGGTKHHMAIMNLLLEHGYDWNSLMNAKQAWGWILSDVMAPGVSSPGYGDTGHTCMYRLSTDAAAIDPTLAPAIEEAITAISGRPAELRTISKPSNGEVYAPTYDEKYGEGSPYNYTGLDGVYVYDSRTKEQHWVPMSSGEMFEPPDPDEPEPEPQHPVPGGGTPPPKKEPEPEPIKVGDKYKTDAGEFWVITKTDPNFTTVDVYTSSGVRVLQGYQVSTTYAQGIVGKKYGLEKVSMWKEARTKFVYDTQTDHIETSDDWRIHHGDLVEKMLPQEGDFWLHPDYIDSVLNKPDARFVYGEHYPGEEPFIHHKDLVSPQAAEQALNAYQLNSSTWKEASSRMGRYAWLVDWKHQIKISQLGEHHVDIGWGGGEAATGDVLVDMDGKMQPAPGQITFRVLTFDWEYDLNEVMDRVAYEWDRLHPDLEITKYENLAAHPQEWDEWSESDEGLTNHASRDIMSYYDDDDNWIDDDEGPSLNHKFDSIDPATDPDGHQWQVYQMESGEYKNHHAIMVDNNNKRLFVNYHGHHGPMMEAGVNSGLSHNSFYDTVQGHYRLEPSDSEPFGEGWGFHFGKLTPWQEQIFENALRSYHGVDELEKAWIGHKEATVKWIGKAGKFTSHKWSALYDRENAILYIWGAFDDPEVGTKYLNSTIPGAPFFKNGSIKSAGKYTQAEGNYTTISYILPTGAKDIEKEKAKVKELLEKALIEKWPTGEKETHFKPINQRFMVKKDGSVIMGDYRSHYDLIADYITPDVAQKYADFQIESPDYPFLAGGFFSDCGIIRLVHTAGEPEYDPKKVAGFVAEAARRNGERVNRLVVYEDLRTPARMKTCFNLEGGSA